MLLPEISGTGIANNSGNMPRVSPKAPRNHDETRGTFLSSKSGAIGANTRNNTSPLRTGGASIT